MKKNNYCFIFFLLISIFIISFPVIADEAEYVDREIPKSWFQTPKTASQLGISEFHQSPFLAKKVANGEILPVEERLPEDPIVIEPYNNVGNYGGTIRCWGENLDNFSMAEVTAQMGFTPGQPTPDGSDVIPWIAEGWEYSSDFKEFRIFLRKGLKWSNGSELTADDYIYWWKDYIKYEELSMAKPETWNPPIVDVTKDGKYTVVFKLGKPHANIHKVFMQQSFVPKLNEIIAPAEFMKNFNPKYTDMSVLKEMTEEAGLDDWKQYYQMIQESILHPEYKYQIPVLSPWIAVERTETTLVLERNPYFPFVDTEGNQLPYVDRIIVNNGSNQEMVEMKAMTGETTIEFN